MFAQVLVIAGLLAEIALAFAPHGISKRSLVFKVTRISKSKGSSESKGFKKVVSPPQIVSTDSTKDSLTKNEMISNEDEIDADAIFRKYKISDGQSLPKKKTQKKETAEYDEKAAFGKDLMGNMSFEQQSKIDSILLTAVFTALTFVITSGVAISFGAFKVVYPSIEISPTFENIITNILTPAFTPSLGIFFLFSTTFGLFKFAQISNTQTVYKE